ncbi:hypothetical protein ACG94V_07715 [Acinetobacter sp. ULE_I001]|uniref:hypothetical protein n=1 Tax=unclassified Acinetobacter TaxID=196816 RepID=UPI003AF474DF
MRVQEKYLLKVVSFDPEQEPEEQHIYLIEVYDFTYDGDEEYEEPSLSEKLHFS